MNVMTDVSTMSAEKDFVVVTSRVYVLLFRSRSSDYTGSKILSQHTDYLDSKNIIDVAVNVCFFITDVSSSEDVNMRRFSR